MLRCFQNVRSAFIWNNNLYTADIATTSIRSHLKCIRNTRLRTLNRCLHPQWHDFQYMFTFLQTISKVRIGNSGKPVLHFRGYASQNSKCKKQSLMNLKPVLIKWVQSGQIVVIPNQWQHLGSSCKIKSNLNLVIEPFQ